jgi:NCAIR mutase (PurE)-related protein
MYQDKLKEILQAVKEDKLPVEKAYQQLANLPFEDLGFANIDHHRTIRRGYPEVIFCQIIRSGGSDVAGGFGFAAEQVFIVGRRLGHGNRGPEQH